MVDFQSRYRRQDSDDETEETGDDREETEVTDEKPADTARTETTDQQDDATTEETETLVYAIVTVTDERTLTADATGDAVAERVERAGDAVATRELIAPSYDTIQSTLDGLVGRRDVDAIVTVGGTGVGPDDVTVEAAEALFDKHLPGFGELFRVLSHEQEGTAVVRNRTTAGIIDGAPVFCLPGDTDAARRGVEEIVLDEAGTLAGMAADSSETSE